MGKFSDFLTGMQTLEEVESPINGNIKVVKGLAWGTYIQVEGLTQSGGILKSVWRKPLNRIFNFQFPISNVLILGLGGGTVAGLVRQFWGNRVKITGVDLDPVMVDLGKKYLGLDKYNVNVVIGDAYEYMGNREQGTGNKKIRNKEQGIRNSKKEREGKYDLILVDLYVGREYPKKFEDEKFIHLVRRNLARCGFAIFNRLYFDEKRSQAVKFGEKLEKIFNKVDVVYPEANIMFICSD